VSGVKATLLVMVLSAVPAFACQECIVYEVAVAGGQAVSVKGDPIVGAKVTLRRAIKRSGDRPHVLSCLHGFEKGRVVKSAKTDSQGRFRLGDVPPDTYWLAIRGQNAQTVRVIQVVANSFDAEPKKLTEFQASDTGFTGDQCDVLQAKDFM